MWDTLVCQECSIDTGSGLATSSAVVDCSVPHLGTRNAVVMPGSNINMACMGETCEELNYNFVWPAGASKPHLWYDKGSKQDKAFKRQLQQTLSSIEEVPLVTVSRVPFLMSALGKEWEELLQAASTSAAADFSAENFTQLPADFAESVLEDFFESLLQEFCAEVPLRDLAPLAAAASSRHADNHCLAHYPKDPNCEVCLQGKLTRAPAFRQDAETKVTAKTYGERLCTDLVGPTLPSINDEIYAQVSTDDATGWPKAQAQKTKLATETRDQFWEMHAGTDVQTVRTDNGGEFSGEFHAELVRRNVRHEKSLPRRPQTNSRTERFHRTLAEGMGCMFLASGVPYVFWVFCMMAFIFIYARTPSPSGAPSPFEQRFGREADLSHLQPFGSACYFLDDNTHREKFDPRGRLGVVLGYGKLQSFKVLDWEHYIETKGEARIVDTRDVKFPPVMRFPFLELGASNPDHVLWAHRLFALAPEAPTATANETGRCDLCWKWATEEEASCKACTLGGRRRHDMSKGCLRARCHGHASIDVLHTDPPVHADGNDSSMYSPSSPGDDDPDDFSRSRSPFSEPALPPPSDLPPSPRGGDGNQGPSSGRPRWRADIFGPAPASSSSSQPPAASKYGPNFLPEEHDSGLVPPHPDHVAPQTPKRERSDSESRPASSTVTFESDMESTPRQNEPGQASNSAAVARRLASFTVDGAKAEMQQAGLCTEPASFHHYFGMVTLNIDPKDPRYTCPEACAAADSEIESMSRRGVWDLNSVREWRDVCAEDPSAEVLGAKLLIGIKDWELMTDAELAEALWKARFVCTGNHIVGADGRKIWQVDSLYSAPVDLQNARLVVFYGGMHGCVLQGDVKAAYLQAELGGNATWLRLPKSMRHHLPKWAQNMDDPVVLLLRALYGHPRAGGDWDAHFSQCLTNAGWTLIDSERSLWLSPCKTCVLAVYVDDTLLGGPPKEAKEHMAAIGKLVDMGMVDRISRFLGTNYHLDFRGSTVTVAFFQPEYAALLLTRYKRDRNIDGPLKHVDTPIVMEDLEVQFGDELGPGATQAATHIGGLLFLVRSSRPDMYFAVGFLSRYTNKWSLAAAKRLHRAMEFLESTLHHGVSWVIDMADRDCLRAQLFVDADHGGCVDTARSTQGFNFFLTGNNTKALLDSRSQRQDNTAKSTPEAEAVAGANCLQQATPLLAAAEEMFGSSLPLDLLTDNDAARAAFQQGYSRKLRYLKKHQRVSLGFVRDLMEKLGLVGRIDSDKNNSDVHTKPLSKVSFQKHCDDMGVKDCKEYLSSIPRRGRAGEAKATAKRGQT
eukprot:TRINITY_DN3965_c1_g1_i1.p1 TRINITY_DN3965_c1_g1~~TRINITY_DN3965_c1_g1_i1.p1  ORF type:complete len:1301 (-),score=320.83 TRINITY_DN3965_c1_g1_i1:1146-5048(-)